MNAGDSQIVDQLADATVAFVDIVDFTKFSGTVPAEESMLLLRDLFSRYDQVIERYELEKIKTIGDSYMYVSGVTNPVADHCATSVDAALELLYETRQMALAQGRDLQVRIGVHSGPMVAGVVGDFRFVYDLWGMTVNMAARLEEAGKPGKVTVSQAVIDRIGTEFTFQRQSRVRLKGIGATILFSIEGRRSKVRSGAQ
jgi:class 3 adenylate cyclase